MKDPHQEIEEIIQECNKLLDRAADLVVDNQIEPGKLILQNIGMAIGEILHAKKRVKDHKLSK